MTKPHIPICPTADASDKRVLQCKNTWLCNELLNTLFIPWRRLRCMVNYAMVTTMNLFQAFTHSKFEMRPWCDDFFFFRPQWNRAPIRDSVNVQNNGHGGLAIKTFGLALRRSLLHLTRRVLVSKFQPVSRSAATPVLMYSGQAAWNVHCRDLASRLLSKPLRTSPNRSSQDLAPIPCCAFPGHAFDVQK